MSLASLRSLRILLAVFVSILLLRLTGLEQAFLTGVPRPLLITTGLLILLACAAVIYRYEREARQQHRTLMAQLRTRRAAPRPHSFISQ